MRKPTLWEVTMKALGVNSIDEVNEDLDIKTSKLKPIEAYFGENDQYKLTLKKVNTLSRITIDEEGDFYDSVDYAYFEEDSIRRVFDFAFSLNATEATVFIQQDFYDEHKEEVDKYVGKLGKVSKSKSKYLEFHVEFFVYLTADDIVDYTLDFVESLD